MLLWLAVGGALVGALARWRLAEARDDRRARAADAERRARRHRRGRARVTRIDATNARLFGMPAYRLGLELDLPDGPASLGVARALTPIQLAWVQVGATVDLTYDPDDLSNFVTELEGRFADEIAARVERLQRARVRVELDAPIWALGHDGVDAWLLPPADGSPRVVIGAFGGAADPPPLAAAAHLAADELALTTSARARVALVVDPLTRTTAGDTDPAIGGEAASGAIVVWSHAPRDAAAGDLTLRVRRAHGEPPPPLTAALADIPAALAAALVDAKLVTPVESPAWFQPPRAAAVAAYARILAGVVRQLLADPARGALAPLSAEQHAELVDGAFELAHAHDVAHVHLVALACVLHAARAGAMTLEHRVYASQLVGHYAGTGHPIDLLAPSYLAAFNLRAEARRRARALRGDTAAFRAAESAYHAWLGRFLG